MKKRIHSMRELFINLSKRVAAFAIVLQFVFFCASAQGQGASIDSITGVAFEMSLPAAFADAAKVAVKGLPAGLKYNTLTRKITGAPTKAGIFNVVISATGVPAQTLTMNIAALPVWAYGEFNGYLEGGGTASMAVSAQGKISGKLASGGNNYTFSTTAYASGSSPESGFAFTVNASAGKALPPLPLALLVSQAAPPSIQTLGLADGQLGSDATPVKLYRNVWKETDAALNPIGYYTATLTGAQGYGSGYLTFTVTDKGRIKTAGNLADGTAVSLSGTLIIDDTGRVFTVIYASPAAYNGGCLFGLVEFVTPDAGGKMFLRILDGGAFLWKNLNPLATAEYASGFLREPVLSGGWYNTMINLRDYYENGLTVGGVEAPPALQMTVKYIDYNYASEAENPPRISWTEVTDVADAGVSPNGLGLSVTPATGSGTGLTAPRAQTPAKMFDPDTKEFLGYNYDLDNPTGLTLKLTRATGIFKGTFNSYYDYVSVDDWTTGKQTMGHVVKKSSYQGALTPEREDKGDGMAGRGFYLTPGKSEYQNLQGKLIKYTYNQSYGFIILQ